MELSHPHISEVGEKFLPLDLSELADWNLVFFLLLLILLLFLLLHYCVDLLLDATSKRLLQCFVYNWVILAHEDPLEVEICVILETMVLILGCVAPNELLDLSGLCFSLSEPSPSVFLLLFEVVVDLLGHRLDEFYHTNTMLFLVVLVVQI